MYRNLLALVTMVCCLSALISQQPPPPGKPPPPAGMPPPAGTAPPPAGAAPAIPDNQTLDTQLSATLKAAGFTGQIESQLVKRLGRPINTQLADLGRNLFFDKILALTKDNACAGCHSPLTGFSDTQPIAIGVGNNNIVGPGRTGPRNMRRAPSVLNTAFYPNLMWNSRFVALSGNPFSNSQGFLFPAPESKTLSYLPNLLTAAAFLPPAQQMEMAGFNVPGGNDPVTGHNVIRADVLLRLNAVAAYRTLFGAQFAAVASGGPITFDMVGSAIAEFEFTLVRATAPLDQFAQGQTTAMTPTQKLGAQLFFGKAGCVSCHAVAGQANEMFSDFKTHVAGIPQIVPKVTNATFDGPNANEDYGYEDFTGNATDRYKFRTSPLRNLALSPWFFHDGAFNRLEDAVAYHMNTLASAKTYSPVGRLPPDLSGPIGPLQPILARLDPLLAQPVQLSNAEFSWLVEFMRYGLLDSRAQPNQLGLLIPQTLPSGLPTLVFQ